MQNMLEGCPILQKPGGKGKDTDYPASVACVNYTFPGLFFFPPGFCSIGQPSSMFCIHLVSVLFIGLPLHASNFIQEIFYHLCKVEMTRENVRGRKGGRDQEKERTVKEKKERGTRRKERRAKMRGVKEKERRRWREKIGERR